MDLKISTYIFLLLCMILNVQYALSQKDTESAMISFNRRVFKYITTLNKEDNIIVSPLAIQRQFLLTAQATSGETHAEILKAAELDDTDDTTYLETFAKKPPEFVCNDHVFYSQKAKLRKPFLTILKMMFEVTPESIDFENTKETAQRLITTMEDGSNGVIRKFVREKDIQSTTAICFMNTAIFAGQWKTNFNKKNTRMTKFYNWGKTETLVSALYGVQYFYYASLPDLRATIISLPYKDSNEKLLIVLPNNRDGLKVLEQKLVDADFSLILRKLRTKLVAISLPHFNIDYRADLPKMLQDFGAKTVFSENSDFSNGFEHVPSSNTPCLFDKFHFDISEYGSAAEEGEDPIVSNEYDSPEKFFLAEHPFIFFIYSNDTIHFFGRVVALNLNTDDDQSAEVTEAAEQTKDSDEDDGIAEGGQKVCGGLPCNKLI